MPGPTDPVGGRGEIDDGEIERIGRLAAMAGVEFVHLQFIDIPGRIKGLTIPAHRLPACLSEGIWVDGSSLEGLARVAEHDLYLEPDLETFAIIPWEKPTTARLICNLVTPSRQPFAADPRLVLARALADAADQGCRYRVAAEVEFYLFDDPTQPGRSGPLDSQAGYPLVPADSRSYFEPPNERAAEVCQRAVTALRALGYAVAAAHHEVSPGQHEIDLDEDDALRTADAIVTLKLVLRGLAPQFGLLPTFMPKPSEKLNGSGIHLGQRLLDARTGESLLHDPSGDHHLSLLGQHVIAGQLAHARGMCAVLAPLVNSYKRLLGGGEAPATVTWATVSRGSFIRVSETGTPGSPVVEVRAPDPSCNPYLALAVLLQAGLDGMRNRTPLLAPSESTERQSADRVEPTADPLPSTLGEALDELGWDMVIRSALGQPVFERFLAAKEQEWFAYRHHISSWELQSYLESA